MREPCAKRYMPVHDGIVKGSEAVLPVSFARGLGLSVKIAMICYVLQVLRMGRIGHCMSWLLEAAFSVTLIGSPDSA